MSFVKRQLEHAEFESDIEDLVNDGQLDQDEDADLIEAMVTPPWERTPEQQEIFDIGILSIGPMLDKLRNR